MRYAMANYDHFYWSKNKRITIRDFFREKKKNNVTVYTRLFRDMADSLKPAIPALLSHINLRNSRRDPYKESFITPMTNYGDKGATGIILVK